MDYGTAVVFLILYFIRPHDWIPGLEGLNIIKPLIALGFFAFMTRDRQRSKGLPGLIRSPLDWVLCAYAGYILFTAPDFSDAFGELLPLVSFYLLTTQALNSQERLAGYLKWWLYCLIAVAALAVGSLVGIDFTGARPITEMNKGRLCLNTWMLNNPNALGHTVIAALPLLWFSMIWMRNAARWPLAILLAGVACFCVYKTESKGAFLSGAAALTAALLFGRSRTFQILSLVLLVTAGGSLLSALPRMQDVSSMRSDEGIQGRVMSWEIARTSFNSHTTGEGFRQFTAYIKWEGEMLKKPPHSSYIQIAADLGAPGLLLYLLLLASALHTLTSVKGSILEAERSRRMLFAMLMGFMISSWMIQRPYHAEFFLLLACVSAYHSLAARERKDSNAGKAASSPTAIPSPRYAWRRPKRTLAAPAAVASTTERLLPTRPAFREFAYSMAMYYGVIATWNYVLATF